MLVICTSLTTTYNKLLQQWSMKPMFNLINCSEHPNDTQFSFLEGNPRNMENLIVLKRFSFPKKANKTFFWGQTMYIFGTSPFT